MPSWAVAISGSFYALGMISIRIDLAGVNHKIASIAVPVYFVVRGMKLDWCRPNGPTDEQHDVDA
jgi:hypothetical protein